MTDPALSATLAAALFAVDPVGLGGVVVRSAAGPARERWLAQLVELLPAATPWRRVPLHINYDRLIGGLDLAATLQAGRPIAQRGLLAEADGGVALLAMAERLGASTAAHISAVIDTQELVAERHGIGERSASRIGVIALDEGIGDDEQVPSRLRERLAFHVTLPAASGRETVDEALFTREHISQARDLYVAVRMADDVLQGLCAAALALGIDSVRAPMLACRAARAAAALDGRLEVTADDAALAAGLVLAPRATQLPVANAEQETASDPQKAESDQESQPDDLPTPQAEDASGPEEPKADDAKPPEAEAAEEETTEVSGAGLNEVVLEAALAALPPGLLASLALGAANGKRTPSAGRVGAARLTKTRGRPTGVRRGEPVGGARLNLIETLRAAAPWQMLRRREAAAVGHAVPTRVQVRREDFHIWRFKLVRAQPTG